MTRRGTLRAACVALVVATAASCSDDADPDVLVELRTDLEPLFEFSRVRSELSFELGGEARSSEHVVADGQDYFAGHRIADFPAVARGAYVLRTQLLASDGRLVAERTIRLRVSATLAVVVLITRDCRGVVCPLAGDDPNATSCVGGTCTSPDCVTDEPECAPPECATDSECAAASACALPRCEVGRCFYEARSEMCGPTERCSITSGCVDRSVDGGRDAGALDASVTDGGGVDASALDAARGDAGPCDVTGRTVLFGDRGDAEVSGVMADTFVVNDTPDLNFGAFDELSVDSSDRSLMRFDLGCAAGATVRSADLIIWVSDNRSLDTLTPFELLEAWDEGRLLGTVGTASYDERSPGVAWSSPGIEPPASRAAAPLGGFVPADADTEYVVPLDVATVQRWVTSPASNFGFVIVSSGNDGVGFHSREALDATKRPALRIAFD